MVANRLVRGTVSGSIQNYVYEAKPMQLERVTF